LLEAGEDKILILDLIFRHFLILYKISLLLPQNYSVASICARLKLPKFYFGRYQEEVDLLEFEDYLTIFGSIYETDRSLKSGGKPKLALSQLGFILCQTGKWSGVQR
jgi:DNA polymerase III delta subunit